MKAVVPGSKSVALVPISLRKSVRSSTPITCRWVQISIDIDGQELDEIIRNSKQGIRARFRMFTAWMDSVFTVVFARYRRKRGDADPEGAWQLACDNVSGSLCLLAGATGGLVFAAIHAFTGGGTQSQNRIWAIVIGFGGLLLVERALNRRFRRFLNSPPALTANETREERWIVMRYRLAAGSAFAALCLLFWVLGQLGVDSLGI